ncbi:hypothetical protein LTR87_004288 [Friedmanniomyces endolithicus]|nr:hypothetical protein LTR87_004288 [Friedmanniomyces endolithicus]
MNGSKEANGIECGGDAAKHFGFASGYRNLNHGSFGTYPKEIRSLVHHYQEEAEARPDPWIRYEYPRLLDESRAAVAKYINAPPSTIVLIPNATTGLNTVLHNLVYQPGDVIIYFATIYGACEKTVDYICETTPASSHKIDFTYPISDSTLLSLFETAIHTLKSSGKTPKLAIFDTIVSLPGVRMPFEQLTALCKQHAILSCIDGAHGVGHISLDLTKLDPDFFFSNAHKWLYTPRACAVFYVPERNDLYEEKKALLDQGQPFDPKYADGLARDEGGNILEAGLGDDEPIGPIGQAVFWSAALGMLHFTFDVLVYNQYRQEIEWPPIFTRTLTMLPILFMLVWMLRSETASRFRNVRQVFYFVTSVAAGCYTLHVANKGGYFFVMKRTPPLGTWWIWSVIEMDVAFAAASIAAELLYLWWKGYTML